MRPPLFRSYSLSGPPSTERYRISVKIEPNGVAGPLCCASTSEGAAMFSFVSSPRGSFILQPGETPIVLLSAGIGATPVLAMLHALSAAHSTRQVLWLHAARDGEHHPFSSEVSGLMPALSQGRSYVCYSRPSAEDTMGHGYDAVGHLSASVFQAVGFPPEAEVYLLRAQSFHGRHEDCARCAGSRAEAHPCRAVQRRRVHDSGSGR